MLVIRNVFHCKPGQAKALVKKFKDMLGGAPSSMHNPRVLTDVTAGFWTVVFEYESESLEVWEKELSAPATADARRPMEGYMDHVNGGYREIFKIE